MIENLGNGQSESYNQNRTIYGDKVNEDGSTKLVWALLVEDES